MIFGLIWLVCGILAYGIIKNDYRERYIDWNFVGYGPFFEFLCLSFGLLGPIGLIEGSILVMIYGHKKIGLCYRMPRELCEGTPEFEARQQANREFCRQELRQGLLQSQEDDE